MKKKPTIERRKSKQTYIEVPSTIVSKRKSKSNLETHSKESVTLSKIEEGYKSRCKTVSDINEHLPTLMKYATGLDTVIEMGTREAVSTYALLQAVPKKVISYDINMSSNIRVVQRLADEAGLDYEFIKQSTLECDIPECDMLFIDTFHVYEQLQAELARHSGSVKKYIAFHDTISFRHSGESLSAPRDSSLEVTETNKGLWDAIVEFLEDNSEWELKEEFKNNNGLTIIERV